MSISPSESSGFNFRQVDTPEQLDALVSALGDNTYRQQLVTYLSSLGGDTVVSFVENIFEALFSDEITSFVIFYGGQQGMRPFFGTPLYNLVLEVFDHWNRGHCSDRQQLERALKNAFKRAYGRQTLIRPERNYSTTRKELLAVVTFVKIFHHYLAGKRFILRTDHQALRWLENFKDPTGQFARWQADLLEYSHTVIHRASKKHQNADALSRQAQTPPPDAAYAPATAITIGTPDHSEWASAQASDPYISLIYDRLRQGAPKPSSEEMRGSSWEARCLWSAWNSLRLCDGVILPQYSPTDPRRLVLPHDAIHPTLSRLHADLGHTGQARTDTAARQRFWCPNQRRIIQDICNTCPVCAGVKNPNPTQRAPLKPIQAGYPNEIVGVDLMGPMSPSPAEIVIYISFSGLFH
ncbi:hypothetical protein SprV_0501746900 [Sparganum proliferum]